MSLNSSDGLYRNAVLDSNVCIGNDVSITNMYGILEADRADTGGFMIQVNPHNLLINQ